LENLNTIQPSWPCGRRATWLIDPTDRLLMPCQ
jgi:hypothetical protein